MSKSQILFNKPEDGNFWLTNFQTGYPIKARLPSKLTSEGKIAIDSVFLTNKLEWKTSEHLFQALKYSWFDGKEIHLSTHIQTLKTPEEAQKFTWRKENKTCPPVRKDWHKDKYKLNAMRWVIREKFTQHPKLKQKLIGTGNADLIEETKERKDEYWGVSYGKGENWLGKILMEVREKLRTEKKNSFVPPSSPEKPKTNNPEPETPAPSKNPPNPNDNKEPPEKKPSPSIPNSPLPSVNINEINEAKELSKSCTSAKKQIQQLFQKSNLSKFDLKKELQNWESQLEKFNSKQEVIELVKQMEIEINQKLRDISRKNNQNKSPSKPNFPPPLLILVVGGGFLGLVLIACLAWKRKRIKK